MPVTPAASLIATDNRLLSGGLSDMTLYGVQPVVGMTVGRAGETALLAPDAPATIPGPAAPTVPADLETPAPDLSSAGGGAAGPQPSPVGPVELQAPAAADAAPAAPSPVGSGTAVQPPIVTPLQAVPAVEAAGASAAAAVPADTAPGEAPTVATALTGSPATTIAFISPVVAGLTDQVAGNANDLLSPAADVATDLVDTLADGVGPLIPTLASTADVGIAGAVSDAADTIATVGESPGLDGLGGTDPASGVATLVGMVASADAFDFGHVATPEPIAGPGSVLDTLVADEAPAALLGIANDPDGTGPLPDDHTDALGL